MKQIAYIIVYPHNSNRGYIWQVYRCSHLPLIADEGLLKNVQDLYSQLDILCKHVKIVHKGMSASNGNEIEWGKEKKG